MITSPKKQAFKQALKYNANMYCSKQFLNAKLCEYQL